VGKGVDLTLDSQWIRRSHRGQRIHVGLEGRSDGTRAKREPYAVPRKSTDDLGPGISPLKANTRVRIPLEPPPAVCRALGIPR
jgi:hypothetical protein